MPTYERWKYCQVEGCNEIAEYECMRRECNHPEVVTILEIVVNHPQFLCAVHYSMGEESGAWDD